MKTKINTKQQTQLKKIMTDMKNFKSLQITDTKIIKNKNEATNTIEFWGKISLSPKTSMIHSNTLEKINNVAKYFKFDACVSIRHPYESTEKAYLEVLFFQH